MWSFTFSATVCATSIGKNKYWQRPFFKETWLKNGWQKYVWHIGSSTLVSVLHKLAKIDARVELRARYSVILVLRMFASSICRAARLSSRRARQAAADDNRMRTITACLLQVQTWQSPASRSGSEIGVEGLRHKAFCQIVCQYLLRIWYRDQYSTKYAKRSSRREDCRVT